MQTARLVERVTRYIVVCCLLFSPFAPSPAQDQPRQIIVLKNPTPREPDLEKRFAKTLTRTDPARLAAYHRQRLQLTQRATAHLVTLATVLQNALNQKQVAARVEQEVKVAEALEKLAGNVHTAMNPVPEQLRPKQETATPGDDTQSEKADHTADADQLVTLVNGLQMDVSRSTVDSIAVGVLIKSAQIQQLAHCIQRRLHGNPVVKP